MNTETQRHRDDFRIISVLNWKNVRKIYVVASETPVVFVMARTKSLVDELVKTLSAQNLTAAGTTSLDKAIDEITAHQPKVLIADPGTRECSILLQRSGGWNQISLVAIAESAKTVRHAEKMGINTVIPSKDTAAIIKAVLEHLQK